MAAPLTRVRYDESAATPLLQRFLFGDIYAPLLAPRGIDPGFAARFVLREVKADSSARVYQQVLTLARFYELSAVVPHLETCLTRSERDLESIVRATCVLQVMGELGTEGRSAVAARYLDTVLVPLPSAPQAIDALIDAHISLTPGHTLAALRARIERDLAQAAQRELESEETMVAYDRLWAIQHNALPTAEDIAGKKTAILGVGLSRRVQELVALYLGQSTVVGLNIETWAGRMLRREAFSGSTAPVLEALAQAIDAAVRTSPPKNQLDFVVCRAADAIIYLGGQLSGRHAQLNAQVEHRTLSFLWDNP